MAIFEDVTLVWDGQDYTIPSNKVMGLIHVIERQIKFHELFQEGGPLYSQVAYAYAAALQYAGAKGVIAEDIYADIMRRLSEGDAEFYPRMVTSIKLMMMPPENYQPPVDPKPKPKATTKKQARSKSPTKRL